MKIITKTLAALAATTLILAGCVTTDPPPEPPPEPPVVQYEHKVDDPPLHLKFMTDFQEVVTNDDGSEIFRFEKFDLEVQIVPIASWDSADLANVIEQMGRWIIEEYIASNGQLWMKYIQKFRDNWYVGYITIKDAETDKLGRIAPKGGQLVYVIDVYHQTSEPPEGVEEDLNNNVPNEHVQGWLKDFDDRVEIVY